MRLRQLNRRAKCCDAANHMYLESDVTCKTRVLGQGAEIPAVGGVIRPELVIALEAKA